MEDSTSKAYAEPDGSQPLVAQGAGSQLFVINLCASIAPVPIDGRNMPGLENYKLYQVARVEDGRTRHRLRLGFFTNEAHAERVLTVVRQQYPTAFTASLSDEDRRFTRGYVPAPAPAASAVPAPVVAAPVVAAAPAAAPARPAVAVVNTPAPAAPARPAAPAVTTAAQAAPSVAAPAAQAPRVAPVQVAAPAVPNTAIAAKLAPTVAAPVVARPAAPAPAPVAKPAAAKIAQPAKPAAARKSGDEVVEMTWEPDEETKAAATSTSLPKFKAFTEAVGLDDMSWDEELPPPTLTSTSPGKEPLAVGLLSGRFAALDPSKFKPSKPAATTKPAPAAKPTAAAKPAAAAKPVAAARPATPPAPQAVPPKLDTSSSVRVPVLTFSDPVPTPASAQKSNGSDEPYHVGKGVKIEDVEDFELDLFEDPPTLSPRPGSVAKAPAVANKKAAPPVLNKAAATKPAAPSAPIAKAPAKPAAPVAKPAPAAAKPAPMAAKPAAPVAPVLTMRDATLGHPNLDSTQTIRALTTEEMNDAAQEKWFAIQLAVSEQPVNLDTMPHLDIFEAYSLYSVATAGSGKIVHSLRLGFFKEDVSAEAVSGYLKTFFASPSVIRISVAEQARFKDAPQPRRAQQAEEPKSNVVELNNARRPPVVPTVTMEVDPSNFRPGASGSLNPANGAFKPGATGALKGGTFKPGATGAFKLNSTGVHKAMTPDGKIAAKAAGPAMRRSEPTRGSGNTGKHKLLKKSLADELLEEAREVELSESGIRKMPQGNSLLSRLLGKKK